MHSAMLGIASSGCGCCTEFGFRENGAALPYDCDACLVLGLKPGHVCDATACLSGILFLTGVANTWVNTRKGKEGQHRCGMVLPMLQPMRSSLKHGYYPLHTLIGFTSSCCPLLAGLLLPRATHPWSSPVRRTLVPPPCDSPLPPPPCDSPLLLPRSTHLC
jgi:hypothetical protein